MAIALLTTPRSHRRQAKTTQTTSTQRRPIPKAAAGRTTTYKTSIFTPMRSSRSQGRIWGRKLRRSSCLRWRNLTIRRKKIGFRRLAVWRISRNRRCRRASWFSCRCIWEATSSVRRRIPSSRRREITMIRQRLSINLLVSWGRCTRSWETNTSSSYARRMAMRRCTANRCKEYRASI